MGATPLTHVIKPRRIKRKVSHNFLQLLFCCVIYVLETLYKGSTNNKKLNGVEVSGSEKMVLPNIKKTEFNSQLTSGLVYPDSKGDDYSH